MKTEGTTATYLPLIETKEKKTEPAKQESAVTPPLFDIVQVLCGSDGRPLFKTVGEIYAVKAPESKVKYNLFFGDARFIVFEHRERIK